MTVQWRAASRKEIQRYYREEFPDRIEDLPAHITPDGPKEFGIAFREPHPVRGDEIPPREFIRRDTWCTTRTNERRYPEFKDVEDLLTFIQYPARNDPLAGSRYALGDPDILDKGDPVPDSVYYSLDHWDRPWLLMIDIDGKDVAKERAADVVDDYDYDDRDDLLRTAGILSAPPAGYPYAFEDIDRALEYGFEVQSIFESDLAAQDVQVMYSGQGAHVYLYDDDPMHRYDEKSREVLNDLLQRNYGVPIDPVVTADRSRFGRLPYSLHSAVCRVVQPVASLEFDPRTDPLPEFLDVARDSESEVGSRA